MKIKIPKFKTKPVMIRQTYIDKDGKTRELTKTIMLPTGELVDNNQQ